MLLLVVNIMDPIKIGKFISSKRKENNMSQSDLASILNVTNQAVSKWENGRGIPDIEMLKKLSEVFNINIEEILSGEENKKNKRKNIFYFIILLIVIVLFGGTIVFLNNKHEDFYFSSLATDNDNFSIKGVMAYSKDKKSIYISEVNYDGKDEEKYKSMECILYESSDSLEKTISKYGDINDKKTNMFLLTELLKGVEFNIDSYECSCAKEFCNNLFLRINVKNIDNKIITYQIPIQLDISCEA